MFISVVLPAPFSPSSPRTSPAWRTRSTERLACTAPKRLSMPRNSSSGADSLMDIGQNRGAAASTVPAAAPVDQARRELLGLRGALVDRHPEGSIHDLLGTFGNHRLDVLRQLVVPGV